MTLAPGTTVGRYQILEPLGQGGMATVYKAFQPSLQREVALKVLRPGYAQDQEFRERFEREAIAIAKLRHPHIVQVFDFEIAPSGEYVLAMEFLEGGTLKERLSKLAAGGSGLDPKESVRIIGEAADALSYAHEKGVVHRDVKPSNVMLTQKDRAVVTDFGIARILGATSHTQTGVGIGTPEYMAPEQGQGTGIDHRADIYSLGAMAYELLTGRVPYSADTPLAVVLAHIKDPLPLPSKVNPTTGKGVEKALLRALAKDPAQRFETATAFAEALTVGLAEDSKGGTMPTVVVRGAVAATAARATSAAPAGIAPTAARRSLSVSIPRVLAQRPALLGVAAGLVLAIVAGTVVASNALRGSPEASIAPTVGTATAAARTPPPPSPTVHVTVAPTPTPKFAVPSKGALIWEAKLDGTSTDIRGSRGLGIGPGADPTASDLRFVPGAIEFVILKPMGGTGFLWNSPGRDTFVMEVDVQAPAAGMIFCTWRMVPRSGLGYRVAVDMRAGRMEIQYQEKSTSGQELTEPITPSATAAEVTSGAFTLAVVVERTHYTVYANQRKVVEATDDRLTGVPVPPNLFYGGDPSMLRVAGLRMYEPPK